MPTVLTISGMRVVIYPNDHRPAHVHVISSDCEAVFNLRCPKGPPELRENYGFSRKELGKIADKLIAELTVLCDKWKDIHENY
jgi:hypothetical protein